MPSVVGNVNEALEARITIRIIGGPQGALDVECIIDTGFSGALVLPSSIVELLELPIVGHEIINMVGEAEDSADIALAQVEWFGEVRREDVIVKEDSLIGTALLKGTSLAIDYVNLTLSIDKQ
jgi:clan AA aspartic protease